MTPTGFEAELRTRKNVGIIGDFAIFNEEIMKKNRVFFSPIFSNFSVKKRLRNQVFRPFRKILNYDLDKTNIM